MPLSRLEQRGAGERGEEFIIANNLSCLPGKLQFLSVMIECYIEGTRGAQRKTLILMRGPRTNPREIGLVICGSAQVGGEGKNLPGRGSSSCKGQR